MIITEQKPFTEILNGLKGYRKIFLVGCGECATTCETGGKEELARMQKQLEESGKVILGAALPEAPCVAAQIKTEFAKNTQALKDTEAILVLACGLGVQSVKENDRFNLDVFPACNTLFGAIVDKEGNFLEKCSLCGECILDFTCGICPITLCPKGMLNGPCSGVDKGKCEVDKEMDCVWVLIYKELEKKNRLSRLKEIYAPKDFKKMLKPHKLILKKRI